MNNSLPVTLVFFGIAVTSGPFKVYRGPQRCASGSRRRAAPVGTQFNIITSTGITGTFGTVNDQTPLGLQMSIVGGNTIRLTTTAQVAAAQWQLNGSGTWSTAGNWTGGVPNSLNSIANFNSVNASCAVTVDSSQKVGSVNFNSPQKYTIDGSATLTINTTGAAGAINVTAGSHDITAPLQISRNTTISVAGSNTLNVTNLQPCTVNLTKTGTGAVVV